MIIESGMAKKQFHVEWLTKLIGCIKKNFSEVRFTAYFDKRPGRLLLCDQKIVRVDKGFFRKQVTLVLLDDSLDFN